MDLTALVAPYVDAVGLNCGCPQRWAMQEGIGAAMIEKPELIVGVPTSIVSAQARILADIVKTTRRRAPGVAVEVKIRLHADVRRTVDLVRAVEQAGADWLTVHGRTAAERATPVHYDGMLTCYARLTPRSHRSAARDRRHPHGRQWRCVHVPGCGEPPDKDRRATNSYEGHH